MFPVFHSGEKVLPMPGIEPSTFPLPRGMQVEGKVESREKENRKIVNV